MQSGSFLLKKTKNKTELIQRDPSSFSSTRGHTEVFTLLLRLEAVAVSSAAAVPEAGTFALFGVEEPHHGVILTAAGVLAQETGVCMKTADTHYCVHLKQTLQTHLLII